MFHESAQYCLPAAGRVNKIRRACDGLRDGRDRIRRRPRRARPPATTGWRRARCSCGTRPERPRAGFSGLDRRSGRRATSRRAACPDGAIERLRRDRSRRGPDQGAAARGLSRGQRRGTERLIEAAGRGRAGSARSSSSRARRRRVPARRGADPCVTRTRRGPISWYGVSKREGEEAVERKWKGPGTSSVPASCTVREIAACSSTSSWPRGGSVPIPAGGTRIQIIGVERAAVAIASAAGRAGPRRPPLVSVRPGADHDRRAGPGDRRRVGPARPFRERAGLRRSRPRTPRNRARESLGAFASLQCGQGSGGPRRGLALRRIPARPGPGASPGATPRGGSPLGLGLVCLRRLAPRPREGFLAPRRGL